MENASKALIIAGAILLSILLISLGIMIYNQAQDTVSNSGMSQAEQQAFNNKFTKYEGTISGAEAKALINEIIASNSDSNNSHRQVEAKIKSTKSYSPSTSSISTSTTYTVTIYYANSDVMNSDDYKNKTSLGCVYLVSIQ